MSHVLKINTNEATRYDFDVAINGLDSSATPEVRFVVEGASFDAAIQCTKSAKGGWEVCIPALPMTEAKGFKVEVIVDGYHFIPVTGKVQLVSTPRVGLAENFRAVQQEKPTVQASFTPKAVVEAKASAKTLLEYQDMSSQERRNLSTSIKGAAHVMKKASSVFESMANRDIASMEALGDTLKLLRKSIASVEMHIYT